MFAASPPELELHRLFPIDNLHNAYLVSDWARLSVGIWSVIYQFKKKNVKNIRITLIEPSRTSTNNGTFTPLLYKAMTLTTLFGISIILSGLVAYGPESRNQAQYPRHKQYELNYSMECSKHLHYAGRQHFYCHEGENVAYMSTLKTNFSFPKETEDANIFIKTKYVYKLYLHGRVTAPDVNSTSFSTFSVSKYLFVDDTAFQFNFPRQWKRFALLSQSLQALRIRSVYANIWVRSYEYAGLVYFMNTKDIQSINELTFNFNAALISSCAAGSGLFHSIGNHLQITESQIFGQLQMQPKRGANFTLVAHAHIANFVVTLVNSEYCVFNCCLVIDNTLEENMVVITVGNSRHQQCPDCLVDLQLCEESIEPEECTGCCKDVLTFKMFERSTGSCFDPIDDGKSFTVTTFVQITVENARQYKDYRMVFVGPTDQQKNSSNITFTKRSFDGNASAPATVFDAELVRHFYNIYFTGEILIGGPAPSLASLVVWSATNETTFVCLRFYLKVNITDHRSKLYFLLTTGEKRILVMSSIFNMTFDSKSQGEFGTLNRIEQNTNLTLWNTSYRGIGASAVPVSWIVNTIQGDEKRNTVMLVSNCTMGFFKNFYGDDNAVLVFSAEQAHIQISKLKLVDMYISVQSECIKGKDPDYVRPVDKYHEAYINNRTDDCALPQDSRLECRNKTEIPADKDYIIASAGLVMWLQDCNFTLVSSALYQNISFRSNSDRNGIIYALATRKTRVNVTDCYVCYNVTFETRGNRSLSGFFPGAMSSSRHMNSTSLIDRVNATLTVLNSSSDGTGFLAHVYKSNWTISNINMTLELQTDAKGVGFIGLLHNNRSINHEPLPNQSNTDTQYDPQDLKEFTVSIQNYTGHCNVSGTHGVGNIIGKCDYWYGLYIDNVTLWGVINSTRDFKFANDTKKLDGWDLRKVEQRCNGLLIGHIMMVRFVNISNLVIERGSVNVTVVNAGAAHGLLIRANRCKSGMAVNLSNYNVGVLEPIELYCSTKDAEGCGSLCSYADGANYTFRDMIFSVVFHSNSGNGMIDACYPDGEKTHTGGVVGYTSASDKDGNLQLSISNYTLSFVLGGSTNITAGAVAGTAGVGRIQIHDFILRNSSGIKDNKCFAELGKNAVVSPPEGCECIIPGR